MPTVSVAKSAVTEGGNLVFTVQLSSAALGVETLKYRLVSGLGNGSFGTDELSYGLTPGAVGTLAFLAGETSKTIVVNTPSDSVDELDENFTLELFDPANATFPDGAPALRAMGTVFDNDGAGSNVAVFVGSPIIVEGNSGTKTVRFEVQLSQAMGTAQNLAYETINGSAIAGEDYTAKSGTVSFAAGQTSAFVDVTVSGDTVNEGAEKFFLRVTPPASAPSVVASVGTATILNNDGAGGLPSISVENGASTEGDFGPLVLRLDQPSATSITVKYRVLTQYGFGSFGTDELNYDNTPGEVVTVTFLAGETSKTVFVRSPNDSLDELDESFTLELFDPVNAVLSGGVNVLRTTGIVFDNDGAGSNTVLLVGSPILLEGSGGTKVARFEIQLSQPMATAQTLDFQTINGSAIAGEDYTAKSGSVSFAAGQTSAFVDVAVSGDTAVEGTENFFLKVTPPASASSIATSVGTATIINDDGGGGLPLISVENGTATEGDYVPFVLRLDQPSATSITVKYRVLTQSGFGSYGTDELAYDVTPGQVLTVTFLAGETSKTILLRAPNDSLDELDEAFTLELFDPVNAALTGNANVLRATGIVFDNDGAGSNVVVAVGSPILLEGNGGTKIARFEVQLSQPIATAQTLDFQTVNGSAIAGEDYTAKSGTISFVAGQTSAFVDVTVSGDTAVEGAENFFLKVTPPASAPSIASSVGTATILNDDGGGGLPSISVDNGSAVEGDYVPFVLRLDQASATSVTVKYRVLTQSGLGSFGTDELAYDTTPGQIATVTFLPGETSKTVFVRAPNDSLDEVDESFTLELFEPANAALTGGANVLRATGVVFDNDGAGSNVVLTVSSPIMLEGSGGTKIARFEVQLSQPMATAQTLDFQTINGSAISGEDYTAKSGTINFAAGQTSAFVEVTVSGDTQVEGTENFFLKVTPPAAAPTIAASVGTATILNDDGGGGLPSISIANGAAVEGDYVPFVLRLDAASATAVTVSYRVAAQQGYGSFDNSELAYDLDPGLTYSVTFLPGEVSKTVFVRGPNDSLDEVDESFTLELFDPVNAALSGGVNLLRATGIVFDNDGAGSNTVVIVGSPILHEGNSGTKIARFEVQLSQPMATAQTLDFQTINGSAIAGEDYTAKSGTISFAAGQTSAFVDVSVSGDTKVEGREVFFLKVTPPAGAPDVQSVIGTATILNDDSIQPLPSVSVTSSDTPEGYKGYYLVQLDAPSTVAITMNYRFVTEGNFGKFSNVELDYDVNPGQLYTLTFQAGQTSKGIFIGQPNDSTDEIDENYTLELLNVVNAEFDGGVPVLRASGMVQDDDGLGNNYALAGSGAYVSESPEFGTELVFEVQLTRAFPTSFTVNYATANGTAIAGQDYTATSGQITFVAGQTRAFVRVPVINDTLVEGLETVVLNLTPGSVAVGPASLALEGTIYDNDLQGANVLGTLFGDVINGTAAGDTLQGSFGNDIIFGGGGNDLIAGNQGNDIVDGGAGTDTIAFSVTRAQARIRFGGDGSLTISAGADGVDTLTGVEKLQFSDGLVDALMFNVSNTVLVANFAVGAGGWTSQDQYPRHVADVNGDGYADIVGFGYGGVVVAFGMTNGNFSKEGLVVSNFGQTAGWTNDNSFHRELADVNGDGRADIVGFGLAGTLISLAKADGTFNDPVTGVADFGTNQGWTSQNVYARTTGDVNGDGKADLIGFGTFGTLVALGSGDGTFGETKFALNDFGVNQGWSSDNLYHRAVADVNGDGKDDIIGFGVAGTLVALSNGNGTFATATSALDNFGSNQGWLSQYSFARAAADMNGDGYADIVGFGYSGTYIAYGRADGKFSTANLDVGNFGYDQGWTSDNSFHRTLADIDNDGFVDIVGFGYAGVYAGLNQGDFLV